MKKHPWVVTVIFCAIVFSALAAYKVFEIKAVIAFGKSFPEPSATVVVVSSTTQPYTHTLQTIGTVLSPQALELRNELSGTVKRISFKSGQTINKGQLLLQLDTSTEQATINSLQARLTLAHSVLKRTQSLRKTNATSQQQLDQASAQIAILKADLAAQESIAAKKTIRAPYNGVIGIHQLNIGQLLNANSFIANFIGNDDNRWIDFKVPHFYPQLAVGSAITVLPIASSNEYKATVIAEDTLIDKSTRSRHYRAEIPTTKAGLQLTSNGSVSLQIPLEKPQQLVAVTNTSIQHDPAGDYVYLLVADQKIKGAYRASRRDVIIERRQKETTLLKAGLAPDERIAGDGAFKIRDGLLVYAAKEKTASNTATAR